MNAHKANIAVLVKIGYNQGTMSNNTPRTTYLITGAGTIGLAYVRYLIQSTPHRVVVIDRSESAVAALLSYQESLEAPDADRLRVLWADLSDPLSLEVLKDEVIHVVVHTAATKHFSLGEAYPDATYQSNMQSFETVWNWARREKVQKFIFTSTDKVTGQSTNSMIRAKQDIEKIIQNTTDMPGVIVRFGNVLDSSDSLLPVLRSCTRENRPFSLHHPDMTRYLATVGEATQVIHHAVTKGQPRSTVSKLSVAAVVADIVSVAAEIFGTLDIQIQENPQNENLHEALYTTAEVAHTRIDEDGFLEYRPDFDDNLTPEQMLAITSSSSCALSRDELRKVLEIVL